MYNVVKRYCENDQSNGLLLLDMPTGSGKTYTAIKYIFDYVQNTENKRKFFFVTTLKKNLPEKELRDHFEKAGQKSKFENTYLRLDAYYESVIEGFDSNTIKNIPYDIKKTDEYKQLEQSVQLVKELRNQKTTYFRSTLRAAEDKLRKEDEPKFRKFIQGLLAKKYTKADDRLYAIKTDKEWQWVANLYPSVYMRERQIIFMTMDKFLSQNSTIVEPSTMLYNSDIIDNAVIFIDEFDATKETVLKNIIQNGLRDKDDSIELFNAIYSVLHTHVFPSILTTSSKKRQEGKYKDQSLQDIIDKTVKISDEIHDCFTLKYSHRTQKVTDDNINNFLFQDHQYHSILNGKKLYITSESNHNEKLNKIVFTEQKPEKD